MHIYIYIYVYFKRKTYERKTYKVVAYMLFKLDFSSYIFVKSLLRVEYIFLPL